MLANITESDLKVLLDAGKRNSVICGVDFDPFIQFSFEFVKKYVPSYLEKGDIESIIKLGLKEKGKKYKQPTLKESMEFLLWCYDELQRIAQMEEENLSGVPNPNVIAAGGNDFEIFGALNVVYMLCKEYGWTEEYVWRKKYEDVFNLQLYSKMDKEFQKRLNEIMLKKTKK